MAMNWEKSSAALVQRFEGALPRSPLVEPKKMFGYPAAFVRGNFFVGLHEENVVARLPDGLVAKLAAMKGAAGFDPMRNGKGMKDWFVVPAGVAGDAKKLAALLAAALPLVSELPAKEKAKSAKAKPAPKRTAKKARTS